MVDGLSRRPFIGVGAGAVVLEVGTSSGRENAEAVTGGKVMKTIGVLGGLGPQATTLSSATEQVTDCLPKREAFLLFVRGQFVRCARFAQPS